MLLRNTEYPREVSCRKNSERTKYPIHAAVADGMMDIVNELANPGRYAGVFSQRDGAGCVAQAGVSNTIFLVCSSLNYKNRSRTAENVYVTCRKTALAMACASHLVDLVVLLMKAGAPDLSGDVDVLHRELIKCGDRNRRQVLNNCKYTTAFRREKNPKSKTFDSQAPPLDVVSVSGLRAEQITGTPPRRRLASSGMHALGKLLASDAAAIAKGAHIPPSARNDLTSIGSREVGKESQQEPGRSPTSKPGGQIPLRKQRGRGRFTANEEAPHIAHMVCRTRCNAAARMLSLRWSSTSPVSPNNQNVLCAGP